MGTFASCTTEKKKVVGIDFKNIAFEKALKQAKKQDKLIFIDFYTEWCGPCKELAKGPFKDSLIGEFYNKHFISLKLDAEKEGMEPAKKYGISGYPTLMFIDGEGNVIHGFASRQDRENLIQHGEAVMRSYKEGNQLKKLQAEYEKKKNDEAFLKEYIDKAIAFGLKPCEAIDLWLRIQTEIKEDSKEMFQYLLLRRDYLLANSCAWDLVDKHYKTYSKDVNLHDEMSLKLFREEMLTNTISEAFRLQSADLMRLFIDKSREIDMKEYRRKSMDYYELMYLLLKNDVKVFKNDTENYVESMINQNPLAKVKKADEALYNRSKGAYEKRTDYHGKLLLKNLKEGRQANKIIEKIVGIARHYLQHASEKQDYDNLNKWMDYSYKLVPDQYWAANLKANILYKLGKTKEAIELKRKALKDMPQLRKKRLASIEYELNLMNDGKELPKVPVKYR
jgi:thiol-disulfide isomerase/thioredoxin